MLVYLLLKVVLLYYANFLVYCLGFLFDNEFFLLLIIK